MDGKSKILDLLDQLEAAIPDMKDQLGGGAGADDGSDDGSGMPPMPDEGSPEEEAGESPDEEASEGDAGAGDASDLSLPPMLKPKKKNPLFPMK